MTSFEICEGNSTAMLSSCSSSSSSPDSPPEKCQVCYQSGHGYHFGAFTCRACAAFFRRCHFSPIPNRKCRMFDQKCKPNSKSGRWYCKKCRMNKCLELGMKTDNIQYDRDAFKSSETFLKNHTVTKRLMDRVPVTVEKIVGLPHLVTFYRKPYEFTEPIAFIDMSALVEKAKNIVLFPNTVKTPRLSISNLEQLANGLEEYQLSQKEKLSEVGLVSQSDQKGEWERSMCSTAKWLTTSHLLRNLDDHVKIDLLRSIWYVWGRLERIAMTAKMRRSRLCGKKQFVYSTNSVIDYDQMSTDISWWTPYSFEELGYFFIPTEIFYDDVVWEMMEIQPDSVELTFLLSIITFQLAGKCHGGQLQEETERLQDILSDDLHEYYIQKKTSMYSIRLKKLMRIKEMFLKLRLKRSEKYSIGGCFDMFRMVFSNPEFFSISV